MNITVIGCGYVGLVTAASFSEYGNRVTCLDVDENKIAQLRAGKSPIFENGLETIIQRASENNLLSFTTDYSAALNDCDVCFIAVGTPQLDDGSSNLSYIESSSTAIGENLNHKCLIVDKSTVPVGTAENICKTINKILDDRGCEFRVSVASNPEFLKEGKAITDCMYPDRIIIGSENEEDIKTLVNLYKPFVKNTNNIIIMSTRSAEMTKYAANSMLATKISFMNEIANICETVGADVNDVRLGIGSDHRIGYEFIYPGCGYGGSCFPKDVKSLVDFAKKAGYEANLLKAVDDVNTQQKHLLADKIKQYYGANLNDKTVAIWGLSFKPNTDDMREAPSINVIEDLIKAGARIQAYDPKAIDNCKNLLDRLSPSIKYCNDAYSVLEDADCLAIITEWQEFKLPEFKTISSQLNDSVIFDGRNLYDPNILKDNGIEYIQIGVKNDE